jgi:hypothetical protein
VPTLVEYSSTCSGVSNNYLELIPSRGSLRIIHHGGYYNCCADDIAVWFSASGRELLLSEYEILGRYPCTCRCYYDVQAVVVGLRQGTYTVKMQGHTQDVEIP